MINNGTFIISLDYELMWGIRVDRTIEGYGDALKGVKHAMDQILSSFSKYGVKSTVAVVGFLFQPDRTRLLLNTPDMVPSYKDDNLNPYKDMDKYVGENDLDDPYYFGYSIIKKLVDHELIEIATHTYSHYYCLEEGQTIEQFDADMQMTMKVAAKQQLRITSIIFPRNQFNKDYLRVCKKYGITSFRGTEKNRIYKSSNADGQTSVIRIQRLVDAYVNITGNNCYSYDELLTEILTNIPSSRFYRPYDSKLSFLEPLKIKRIKDAMTYAAKNNKVYHLWWHPHNFGRDTEQNIKNLNLILEHFQYLRKKFGFESLTMNELTSKIAKNT